MKLERKRQKDKNQKMKIQMKIENKKRKKIKAADRKYFLNKMLFSSRINTFLDE